MAVSFNLEEAQICAVLSSMVYDTKQGEGRSWDQLNRILRENADRYPTISHILKNLQVRQDESSFDMACFSSSSTIYIAVRGTDITNVRDVLNDVLIFNTGAAGRRSNTCVENALQWKKSHAGKRVVCTGHSLGGTVALALMRSKVGDFAHVFNYGRGITNVVGGAIMAILSAIFGDADFAHQALHHHIFGDGLSPRYTAMVPVITYKGNCQSGNPTTAHGINNFTDAVARGGWPTV